MIRKALKRIVPASARRPLRRAYDRARDAIANPATLRRAAVPRSRLAHFVEGRPTVVFFAPEAGVTLYLRTQAALARILRAQGCNAVFVRCFELLPRCPVKDMLLLPFDLTAAEERKVCLRCYRDSEREFGAEALDFVDLREILDDAALGRVAAAASRAPAEGIDFDYDGINVGALAFYDFAISHKHPIHEPMSAAGREAWWKYARNAMAAVEMSRALVERFRPVTFACFDEYAMMSAARLRAQRAGTDVRMISIAYHLNGDPRRPVVMSNLTVLKDFERRLSEWPRWRDLPLPPARVAAAIDDSLYRLTRSGTHIYSPTKTLDTDKLARRLRLDASRRTLVAYTSSLDEHDALLVNLRGLGIERHPARDAFPDTFEWLHGVIAYVEASEDLQLVVRVHPRIGVTSRDNRVSTEYRRYRDEFGGEYRHCRFVWPDEPVSSFDLAEFADLALVSWSSIALELARLGVPVLSGNRSIMVTGPEEEFIRHAPTREAYFDLLRRMLEGAADPALQLRLALRWYNLQNLGNAIDLGDVIDAQGNLRSVEDAAHARLVTEVLTEPADALAANLAELSGPNAADAVAAESEALRGQVRRMLHFLSTGSDAGAGIALKLESRESLDAPPAANAMAIAGDEFAYRSGDRVYRRRSRLVSRLADILRSLGG